MNESQFYKLLKTECLDLKLFRIETAQRDGFPDIIYINKLTKFQGLIELKVAVRQPTTMKRTGLRVEQNIFHLDWAKNEGTSYVLCWCEMEQVALLWKGAAVFPAWRDNVIGDHIVIPRSQLNTLAHIIQ